MTVFCFLLVLLFTALETHHNHGDAMSRGSGTPCLMCISAHSSAPAVSAHALPVLCTLGVIVVTYDVEAQGITSRLELFIRPPPSA